MRDTAVGGIAALLNRNEWRDSAAGASIAGIVSAALHDENPVVRMHAASATSAIHAELDAARRVAAVGDILLTEPDLSVRTTLVWQLWPDIAAAPAAVDTVLEQLRSATAGVAPRPRSDLEQGVLTMLTYLALVPQTPFASRAIEQWCQSPLMHSSSAMAFAQHARDYLVPTREVGRDTAYQLLGTAATACLDRCTSDPSEHQAGAELSEGQLDELRAAADVVHEIAQQIYFASGAFDETQDREVAGRQPDLAAFADLALPVLRTCAGLHVPSCVHPAVETMIFLAPVDEARALREIAAAVPAEGPYAADPLAANDVMPYLERLVAEQRALVLFDDDGVAAFRHLLAAFAVAGSQDALALAYTFGDVFR